MMVMLVGGGRGESAEDVGKQTGWLVGLTGKQTSGE
jgi:hypothetical protein